MIIVIIIISVSMIAAIMLLVKSVLSQCDLVYFSSIEPDSLTRRAIVDIGLVSSNLPHWC